MPWGFSALEKQNCRRKSKAVVYQFLGRLLQAHPIGFRSAAWPHASRLRDVRRKSRTRRWRIPQDFLSRPIKKRTTQPISPNDRIASQVVVPFRANSGINQTRSNLWVEAPCHPTNALRAKEAPPRESSQPTSRLTPWTELIDIAEPVYRLPFQTNPINQTKEWSDFKGACTFDRGVSYFLEKVSTWEGAVVTPSWSELSFFVPVLTFFFL